MKRAAALIAILALLASVSMASAQEAAVDGFTIRLVPANPADLTAIEPIEAYVGGVLCGTQEVTADGAIILVGGDGTPGICRTEGALIALMDRHGNELFVHPEFAAGETYDLDNLAPLPPGSGPSPQPATAGYGVFEDDTTGGGLAPWLACLALTLGIVTFGRHLSAPEATE